MVLSIRENEKYQELVKEGTHKGKLLRPDAYGLAMLAKILIRIEDNDASASDQSRARQLLNDYGMTPLSRTRLESDKKGKGGPGDWSQFK